jgi:hypothetical protein
VLELAARDAREGGTMWTVTRQTGCLLSPVLSCRKTRSITVGRWYGSWSLSPLEGEYIDLH